MNIHPAFVHFPIALLFLYALVELIPMARFMPRVSWNPVRQFLLFVGTLVLIPTAATGMMAEEIVGGSSLIEIHEHVALTVAAIFITVSILELVSIYRANAPAYLGAIKKILAFCGMVGLFVVGALGAAIVYGYETDPIVSFVVALFGLK